MEGLGSSSELRKEEERERRRMRDRQRRQSMSIEEREKHLARRRRNYQLRRLRAQTPRLNPPPSPSPSPIHLPLGNAPTCVSDVRPQFNAAVALVGSNHGLQERLMLDTRSSQSLEIPAHKLTILPGKVRLSRIKHLARAINDPVGGGVSIGGMIKGNGTSNCLISKGLRLNRIKCLARALNPDVRETLQSHQSIIEELAAAKPFSLDKRMQITTLISSSTTIADLLRFRNNPWFLFCHTSKLKQFLSSLTTTLQLNNRPDVPAPKHILPNPCNPQGTSLNKNSPNVSIMHSVFQLNYYSFAVALHIQLVA
ncbi:hypothetical protein PTKIN_Ptkin13bG0168600 [Pterospermum kingtungense]